MKIIPVFISILLFISCSDSKTGSKEEHSHDAAATENHQQESSDAMEFNNGSKWKADETTRQRVQNMQSIANSAEPKTSDEYIAVAKNLKSETDLLISECRMQGADHDALHKWLMPYLNEVQALEKGDENASTHFENVKHQLAQFDNYFE
jgi:hypothetical protein